MRVLLLLFVAIFAYADVTATPSSVSKTMRESPSHSGATPQTITPARVQIALDTTPSEAWTVTKGGDLATACFFSSPCFDVEDTNGNVYTDGTGATGDATIVVRWGTGNHGGLTAGVYTGTITVNPATGSDVVIDVTLTVVEAQPYASVIYNGGYPLAGCSNPEAAFFNYNALCSIPDEYPPDTDLPIPDIGDSYVDPRFGGTVTRLTDASCGHAYSTRSPLSVNNTYLLCGDNSGFLQVYKVSDQTLTYSNVPAGNISFTYWSPIPGEDEVLYWLDRVGTVKKRVLNTSTTTTVKDMTGAPWNFTDFTDGGTSKPSSNGFIAFFDEPTTTVCALKLATADVYCADYTAGGIGTLSNIDFVEVEYDSVQDKTYVKFISAPKAPQWEVNVGGGVLTLLGAFDEKYETLDDNLDGDGICETGESCLGQPHSTLMNDPQGRVHMFWATNIPSGDDSFFGFAELSKGAGMLRPVEETGGGLRLLQGLNAASDSHFGGSHNGAGVVSTYVNATSKLISAATSANPAVITSNGHGYSNSEVKVIGGATGNTCINGVWTIANVTANTFELSGSTCSGAGAYDANSAHVAPGAAAAASANVGVIFLVVPGTNGYVKPLAQHRSIAYNGGNLIGCCSAAPLAAISYDGSRIIYKSNMGVPEGGSIYMVETGYSIGASGGGGLSGKAKIVGKGKIF